jgi:hypothetical protein
VREVLAVTARWAIIVPVFLVGIPYVSAHVILLFSNWANLRGLLLFDLILLPFMIGLLILANMTAKVEK